MTWLGGFSDPELTTYADATAAAVGLAKFADTKAADPARYARARAYVFAGQPCPIAGIPAGIVTPDGVVPIPVPAPRRPVDDDGPGWSGH